MNPEQVTRALVSHLQSRGRRLIPGKKRRSNFHVQNRQLVVMGWIAQGTQLGAL